MRFPSARAAFAAACCLLACLAASARTLIHCGAIIDGVSEIPRPEMTIVVEGDRITALHPGFTPPAHNDQLIDLRTATVLPGLIDMHVHLDQQQAPNIYAERLALDAGDFALRASHYARKTLLAGFTTVRVLGDNHGSSLALRRAITERFADGPRIFTSGKSISTTGGPADPTNGIRRELMGDPGPAQGVINGADEARKAVRQRYKEGCDLIKITATGGVLSLSSNSQNPQFTMEELRAIIETAHEYGFKVAAHAHGAEGMKRAVEAGVDSIEHGTFITDEIIALMKERGTYLVPTLSAGRFASEKARVAGFFPAMIVPKAIAVGQAMPDALRRAHAAGVKIAFGTDQGVAPHGENAREFIYMVEAGMSPMAAIQSATLHAATLLGAEADLGTVEPGKFADLIAVRANPLNDVRELTQVHFVMKGGVMYKRPGRADARDPGRVSTDE
jgi:imidazolonepropionase-like amidohydrolase